MTDDARGGNDTIDTQDHSMYTNVHAFGDVAGDMSGNSHGGSDTITGAVGWRGFDNVYAGDAGGSMSGTAQGGNDTLDISLTPGRVQREPAAMPSAPSAAMRMAATTTSS
ncbi:hypothetical protein ACFKHW_21820 [Bradyrhizobium lupini]